MRARVLVASIGSALSIALVLALLTPNEPLFSIEKDEFLGESITAFTHYPFYDDHCCRVVIDDANNRPVTQSEIKGSRMLHTCWFTFKTGPSHTKAGDYIARASVWNCPAQDTFASEQHITIKSNVVIGNYTLTQNLTHVFVNHTLYNERDVQLRYNTSYLYANREELDFLAPESFTGILHPGQNDIAHTIALLPHLTPGTYHIESTIQLSTHKILEYKDVRTHRFNITQPPARLR